MSLIYGTISLFGLFMTVYTVGIIGVYSLPMLMPTAIVLGIKYWRYQKSKNN